MEGGVGVAGNGMGSLNDQNKNRDSVASEEGEWLFEVNTAGVKNKRPRRQVDLNYIRKVLSEPIRGFRDILGQKPPYMLIL
jgi:hypothetical protein